MADSELTPIRERIAPIERTPRIGRREPQKDRKGDPSPKKDGDRRKPTGDGPRYVDEIV